MEETGRRISKAKGSVAQQPRNLIARTDSYLPLLDSGDEEEAMGSVKEGELSSPAAVPNGRVGQGKGSPWRLVGKLLSQMSPRKDEKQPEDKEKKVAGKQWKVEKGEKQKKRSSWLPDPEKRWPVQGW
ncbi:unnamed protein product [Spirodela intermedia]|uniref:Uncharacterized protein n=1 Tax=Spirodela intermedia TaxID=51605 RepID=A0A7I8JW65_SPIIN|nr:unnamed protein product [Spirodela intermedia]